MDTTRALADMGVGEDALPPEYRRQFDEDGYFLVPDYFSADEVAEMREAYDRFASEAVVLDDLPIEPGGAFIADLFNKSGVFDRCLGCRPMLAASRSLLGEIRVWSLNGRNPAQGRGLQALHSDAPRLHPTDWRVVNTLILLDDMSEENGATRVVPGSHRWPALNVSDYNMGDVERQPLSDDELAMIPADATAPHPRERHIRGTAGSVAVINGHIWHGGTQNRTGAPRRILHMALARRDVLPQLDQRAVLTADLKARTGPAQQYLLDIEDADPVA